MTAMAQGYYAKVASSAFVAGTISQITGGKFANGAFSGAFRFMFNDAAHKAAEWAKSKIGSTEYQRWDSHPETVGRLENFLKKFGFGNSNKCNAFVYDALNAGGVPPGRMLNNRIPVALEWAAKVFIISSYAVVNNPNVFNLQVGDIISNGTHVGIYYPLPDGRPGTISASAIAQEVVHNDWGFRAGEGPITVRRLVK